MNGGEQPVERSPFWRRWWRSEVARRERETAARSLYGAIVEKSRTTAFFATLGIPDTTEGRFEVVALHAALVMRRLKTEGELGRALSQELFDLMFQDVDASLRELGVGDMSIGRYVKRFARQFYARIEIIEQTLESDDRARLAPFLASNVWRGGAPPSPEALDRLIDYLQALAAGFGDLPGAALLQGDVDASRWPDVRRRT